MMIRRRHFTLNIGYDITTDMPHSFIMGLGHREPKFKGDYCYRLVAGFAWSWPSFLWRNINWAINEPGYLKGLPVPRVVTGWRMGMQIGLIRWVGREYMLAGIIWPRTWYWVVSK